MRHGSSEAIEVLERLVAFDTTSDRSNLELVDWVEAYLADRGVRSWRLPDDEGRKANLLARVGPDAPGGVVLSGHTDCVPVEGQPWSQDPFVLTRRGDRLVGRGTTDMKGFVAVVLAHVERMVAADLQRPVWLAWSYDEEVGALGARELSQAVADRAAEPAVTVVGEATELAIVTMHKGVRAFRTVVHGADGHSSRPHEAANAIVAAGRIVTFLDDLAADRREHGRDDRFDPPFTTFNVATIAGGQAINIVPRRCELTWEYRPVPADDDDALAARVEAHVSGEVEPALRSTAPDARVETERTAATPSLGGRVGATTIELVRGWTGHDAPTRTVPYATDGGWFERRGIPTVVCGPGTIAEAHRPDESIAVDDLEDCGRLVERITAWAAR